ncbi:MAG: hypothetical protein QOC63_4990 [Mycobacterium sp.]|jgi:hypothetical protein|nr:hypothetical protein [Mycobacterium sp.]
MFEFTFGPTVLELPSGQFSSPFSLSVPNDAAEFFIRIIALFRDNQPLGGESPTIEIRAGQGELTPLTVTIQGSAPTSTPIVGTNGATAGTATCERDNNDIYLVDIADIPEGQGPWELRISNNDAQTLHFVAISSTDITQTTQPWMVWGATPGNFSTSNNPDDASFILDGLAATHPVVVRNLGTGPLSFREQAGVSIGAPDSPAIIATLPQQGQPGQIEPHGVDNVVFGVHQNGADSQVTVVHTMNTNDQLHSASVAITVKRTNFGPPPPGNPCNLDNCSGYVPPPPYPDPAVTIKDTGACIHPGCGHDAELHGLGPRCRLGDGCPGFLDESKRNWGDREAICVQPGCGHALDQHAHFPPPPPPPSPCDECDCPKFVGPISGGPFVRCQRDSCGHSFRNHGGGPPT